MTDDGDTHLSGSRSRESLLCDEDAYLDPAATPLTRHARVYRVDGDEIGSERFSVSPEQLTETAKRRHAAAMDVDYHDLTARKIAGDKQDGWAEVVVVEPSAVDGGEP